MLHALLLSLLVGGPLLSSPAQATDDCGQALTQVPAWSLVDVNPASATHGTTVTLDDVAGKAVLFYVALSTCGHCQSQVEQLSALWAEHPDWADDTAVVILSLASGADEVEELTSRAGSLPVLQDLDEAGVADAYGADRWYVYVLTPTGALHTLHYSVNLSDSAERDRLLAQLDAARGGS